MTTKIYDCKPTVIDLIVGCSSTIISSPRLNRARKGPVLFFKRFKMKKLLVLLFFLCPQLALAQGTFNANSQIAVNSFIALNNVTPLVIKNSGGTVYSIDA